ncbi:type IV pilin protein [Shewanella sp. 10N.286.45.A1]|uniref:type IV pilin protein n=1 Tax=Shewanella sp. 10N.286.45.A1 TaxID=3229694 RepID=UPI003552C719
MVTVTRKLQAFTLIELLIVIAIMGILATVVLPSYQSYIQDGRRSEAQRTIIQHVALLERQYTRMGGYPDSLVVPTSDSKYYSFSYSVADAAAESKASNDATTFTLKATPKSGTSQAGDRCGTLSINQQGAKTPAQGCW